MSFYNFSDLRFTLYICLKVLISSLLFVFLFLEHHKVERKSLAPKIMYYKNLLFVKRHQNHAKMIIFLMIPSYAFMCTFFLRDMDFFCQRRLTKTVYRSHRKKSTIKIYHFCSFMRVN